MLKKDYTVEVYRKDARRKKGERQVFKEDYEGVTKEELTTSYNNSISPRTERFEIHETWVTRRNLMTGKEFKERYDTPYFCSPSSETYWSM